MNKVLPEIIRDENSKTLPLKKHNHVFNTLKESCSIGITQPFDSQSQLRRHVVYFSVTGFCNQVSVISVKNKLDLDQVEGRQNKFLYYATSWNR